MKKFMATFGAVVGLLGLASNGHAVVEYVKICSLYGEGFHYIPGTDICLDDFAGDARQQTVGGTWRSLLPYPEGTWVTDPKKACTQERFVKVGTFQSTDFTLNAWERKQTAPVPMTLKPGEFISKVIMSDGFYDPRIPNRHGANGRDGLCVRSMNPNLFEVGPGAPFNPTYGNGNLPIGCVANSRIVNMPAAYAITATAAHPSIDAFFINPEQTPVSGPYTYGSHLVVATDLGSGGDSLLTYFDATIQTVKPLAGSVSVSVCVGMGSHGPADFR